MPRPIARFAALAALCAAPLAPAQDAARGAGLYLHLPGAASCVSCHGPDLLANRNGFLRAADNPHALQKALNAVGVMGYLKPLLSEQDVRDLAAFLGRVAPLASGDAGLQVWPLVLEFGHVGLGAVAGPQQVRLHNRSGEAIALQAPVAAGPGFVAGHDCPTSLAPGASCTVQVRFAATATGAAGGSVALASAAWPRPLLVALGARTVQPGQAVLQWQPSADALHFDVAAAGGQAELGATLINAGSAPAVLGATSVIGPQSAQFVVQGCAAGHVLGPSERCDLTLAYTRVGPAAADATLQVRSDGSNPPSLALRAEAAASPDPSEVLPPGPPIDTGSGGGAVSWIWSTLLAVATALLRSGVPRCRPCCATPNGTSRAPCRRSAARPPGAAPLRRARPPGGRRASAWLPAGPAAGPTASSRSAAPTAAPGPGA